MCYYGYQFSFALWSYHPKTKVFYTLLGISWPCDRANAGYVVFCSLWTLILAPRTLTLWWTGWDRDRSPDCRRLRQTFTKDMHEHLSCYGSRQTLVIAFLDSRGRWTQVIAKYIPTYSQYCIASHCNMSRCSAPSWYITGENNVTCCVHSM